MLSARPAPRSARRLCPGLELLLGEVYDTVFAGLGLASTFAETTLLRILQRRFLAVQLIVAGRFRCKSRADRPCACFCREETSHLGFRVAAGSVAVPPKGGEGTHGFSRRAECTVQMHGASSPGSSLTACVSPRPHEVRGGAVCSGQVRPPLHPELPPKRGLPGRAVPEGRALLVCGCPRKGGPRSTEPATGGHAVLWWVSPQGLLPPSLT